MRFLYAVVNAECVELHTLPATEGGGEKTIFARDPILGCSFVPKTLPLKDSLITRVLQLARWAKMSEKSNNWRSLK